MPVAETQTSVASPEHVKMPKFALCLSGGGFRATFFHLGVIQALRNFRIDQTSLLEYVSDVYSVSGGTILAAHLTKNWEKYCGSDEEFAEAARELRDFGGSDVRGRVLRRWLLSVFYIAPRLLGRSRAFWLEKEYRKLVGDRALSECYITGSGKMPPNLQILSTSFNTGEQCSFSRIGFEIETEDRRIEEIGDVLPLSFTVTASSAFPPLFPPVKLTRKMLGEPQDDRFLRPLYLSDGGVFDNLGFSKFAADKKSKRVAENRVLVSNAGASLRGSSEETFSSILARNLRATEIMMQRVADQTIAATERSGEVETIYVGIEETVHDDYTAQTTQQRIQKTRTDLDHFSDAEVDMLVAHGYRICAARLNALGIECFPTDVPHQMQNKKMQDLVAIAAEKRKLLPWNPRDVVSYLLVATLLVIFWVGGAVGWAAYTAAAARQAIIEAKAKEADVLADKLAASSQFEARVLQLEQENAELRKEIQLPPTNTPQDIDDVDPAKYRVWIQFAGFKRDSMIELGKALKATWPNIPGADRGGERTDVAATKNEVKYGPDEDRLAAEKLISDIAKTQIVKSGTTAEQDKKLTPGSLEIWVSR